MNTKLSESTTSNEKVALWSSQGYLSKFPFENKLWLDTECMTLITCKQGNFCFEVKGVSATCVQGETLIVPRGMYLSILSQSEDLSVRLFCFRIENLYEQISNAAFSLALNIKLSSKYFCIFSGRDTIDIDGYINLIDSCLIKSEDEQNLYLLCEQKLLLLALANRLCYLYQQSIDISENTVSSRIEISLRFFQLVEKHYETERRLDFYADKLCITTKYLSSVVKQVCDLSAHNIISEYVMSRICYYLINTNKSLQEIAETMNFGSLSQLGIYFKRNKGISPSDFRKKYIHNI